MMVLPFPVLLFLPEKRIQGSENRLVKELEDVFEMGGGGTHASAPKDFIF